MNPFVVVHPTRILMHRVHRLKSAGLEGYTRSYCQDLLQLSLLMGSVIIPSSNNSI